MRRGSMRLACCLLVVAPLPAMATIGVFEHGNGIQSMGMGGVAYSVGTETTALGANPAHAATLGNRWDIGVDMFVPLAEAFFEDNTANPAFAEDARYLSDGKGFYYIPQGGVSVRLNERWSLGTTLLSAGLGPDYDGSPYERFGGARRVSLSLASTSLVTALAYQPHANHALGLSFNVGYQTLEVKGLEFLQAVSAAPDKLTNQGKDGAFTAGVTAGWRGQLTPWLAAGAAYRSRNWTQKHEDYRGLVAEGGRLELPAIYGGGFAVIPAPGWTVALEAQRYTYRKQRAFRNGIAQLEQGQLLGADQGPGFGFNDQNAYKLGLSWDVNPALTLRAGYAWNTGAVQSSETLFGFLACLTTRENYSLGATWRAAQWEVSGFAFQTPEETVNGQGSIPAAFGGGEAHVSDRVIGAGFSLGRRF